MKKVYYLKIVIIALALAIVSAKATVIDLLSPVTSTLTPGILYYNFDATLPNGYTVTNGATTGSTYDGNLTPASFTPAPSLSASMSGFGNAASFLGGPKTNSSVRNQYVNILNSSALNFASTSFTLGTWINLDLDSLLPVDSSQRIVIFDKGSVDYSSGADAGGFSFYLDRVTGTTNTWQLKLQTRGGQNIRESIASIAADLGVTEQWLHLGVSFDATSNSVVFWLNGAVLANDTGAVTAIASTTRGAMIGERTVSGYQSVFSGQLDDFFITSGVHTFAIPEPSTIMALLLAGVLAVLLRTPRRKIGK